ncbi:MAG TPA: ATP-dependent helicase [Pirellulales bacterium]|nr:ATP-dependent helicase [Pirellulales bacterium]
MATHEYETAWSRLNATQRSAADWDEGPLLVLAGPGSGKTRVLTCRVSRILDETKDKAFRILGLTFTNKAADEMRARVMQFVPGEEHRLFLGTFHSFCADVLRQHGTHLGIRPNFVIYSQTRDLDALLADAVEGLKSTSAVVSDLDKKTLPIIQRLKGDLVFPDDCQADLEDAALGRRMGEVYPAYEHELARHNALDFPSLIMRAYELFTKFPVFAKRYRTVFPFVCVDEFQDTNRAQYSLLKAILGEGRPNFFVVADDDQIIYQWNGASHQRIEELANDFRPAMIQLPMNYRCPAEIVDLANHLIRFNLLRTRNKAPLEAFQGSGGENAVRTLGPYDDFDAEASAIAEDVSERHGRKLGQVVILARSRKLLYGIEKALRNRGMSAAIAQRKDEFDSAPFVWLHGMLRLANDRLNGDVLRAVCGSFRQLTGTESDADELMVQGEAAGQDFFRRWLKHVRPILVRTDAEKILADAHHDLAGGHEFLRFCDSCLRWFDLMSKPQESDDEMHERFALYADERAVWTDLRREIIASVGDNVSLEAFLQELEMRSKESLPSPKMVRLYTIHASKGKEFDHVYLAGLVEDELPSFQAIKRGARSPEMEEERRNCFVAITRTSKTLTVSFAKKYNGWPKDPSRFLVEMGLLTEQKLAL